MTKPFKPLLAYTIEDTAALLYPVLVSPKLDGIRCIGIHGMAMSRSMKPIRNKFIQSFFADGRFNGLDGELVVGDPTAEDCYLTTNSGVMSTEGEPDFTYYVFDIIDDSRPFYTRIQDLVYGRTDRLGRFKPLTHHWLVSEEELLDYEETQLRKGYEGVMVRSTLGQYKQGRSTAKEGIIGKLKRMSSDEAAIVGIVELERNTNEAVTDNLGHAKRSSHREGKVLGGTMGALAVRCLTTGCEFQIGTGFTAEQRDWFWTNKSDVVGKIVTYTHFLIGRKDLPRFPSFKGFRSLEDM